MSHWKSFAPQFSPFYRNSLFWLIINFYIKRITHRDTKIISKKKIISNKKKKNLQKISPISQTVLSRTAGIIWQQQQQ